jgi:hypothetical protein
MVAAALPLWTATAVARPAQPPSGATVPSNFNILPSCPLQGRLVKRFFTYTLAPGQSLDDWLMVVNPSRTSPLTIRLSVSDAATQPQGGGITFSDVHQQHQIGRWMHIRRSTVTVAPYHILCVPVTLHLPATVQPGEYEGAVNAINARFTTLRSSQLSAHVYFNRQVLVVLRITGRASAGLQITRVGVAALGTHVVLRFILQNTGTLIDYPVATLLTLARPARTYTLRTGVGLIMGGDATAVPVALERVVPAGTYRVRIQVSYLATPSAGGPPRGLTSTWKGAVRVPNGAGR